MSLSTASLQPAPEPVALPSVDHAGSASLLGMLVLSVYAAQKSNKQFRKLKRRFLWTAFKLKIKSLFSRKADISNERLIIYILLGIVALVLIFYYPLLALLLAVTV